uniref:Uncharacterized protein n=1 Tax=Romanomermis culicivorax TaxID=13658 RepID=A0A915JRR8_ROMCU
MTTLVKFSRMTGSAAMSCVENTMETPLYDLEESQYASQLELGIISTSCWDNPDDVDFTPDLRSSKC